MDAGFGAAGEHDGGVAVGNEAGGIADGVGACRAGCCYGVVGALGGRLGGVELGGWWGEGTLRPCFIDMWPAARLMRSLGTKRGETFLGP